MLAAVDRLVTIGGIRGSPWALPRNPVVLPARYQIINVGEGRNTRNSFAQSHILSGELGQSKSPIHLRDPRLSLNLIKFLAAGKEDADLPSRAGALTSPAH